MFLKHGAKNLNEIELVAPTGFEPVFGRGHVFDSLACGLELRDRENPGTMKHARRTA